MAKDTSTLYKITLFAVVEAESVSAAREHGHKLIAELRSQEGVLAVAQGETSELLNVDFTRQPATRVSYNPKRFAVVADVVVREISAMKAIRHSARITAGLRGRPDVVDAHGIPYPTKVTEQELAELQSPRAPSMKL